MNTIDNKKPSRILRNVSIDCSFVEIFREGLVKMKLVFQENPKFGDEHDVSQQIATIDEHLEQLMSEIRQYEVMSSIDLLKEKRSF